MSQTKAQLIQPIGIVTTKGVVITGVMTATSFDGDIVGSATSIISGSNLNLGIVTAVGTGVTGSGFSGDFTGTATGIHTGAAIKVGQFTASSFSGDFTGTATSMMRGTGFEAGAINATGFHVSGTSTGNITGNVTGNITGNITGVSTGNVTGDVTGNVTGNLVGSAGSVTSGGNIHLGVVTATSYVGDGSNLTGIAATNFNTQTVTSNSAETIIDLSDGNMITMNQSANTVVGFASTSTAMSITILRVKDETTTARTITWPSSIKWNGETAPTLIDKTAAGDRQQFQLITRDAGLSWYAWEPFKVDIKTYQMWGVGKNDSGQFGVNNKTEYSSPVQMFGGVRMWMSSDQQSITSGNDTTAQRDKDSNLWMMGFNNYGTLGLNEGPTARRSSPVQLPGSWSDTGQFNSEGTAMWVKDDGVFWAWGQAAYGLLALNEGGPGATRYSSPVQMGGGMGGKTWDTGGTKQHKMASTGYQWVAVDSDGGLWGAGDGGYGKLGLNTPFNANLKYSSPVQIGTDQTWANIGNDNYGCLAIKTNGTLWSWGNNGFGDLGLNQGNPFPRYDRSSPTQVGSRTDWSFVAKGGNGGASAVTTGGELYSWGYNTNGQIGNNLNGYPGFRSSPVQIPGTWTHAVAGNGWKAGIKSDGSAWSWGSNYKGALGLNDEVKRSSPTQIPGTWAGCFVINGNALGLLKE